MALSSKESSVLRELGTRYMDIAQLDIHKEKMQLWKSLNRMDMQRPMINMDQVPWAELDTDGSLACIIEDPYWREEEYYLRTTIYQWEHFPADMVIEPFISIPRAVRFSGYGIGAEVERIEQYEGSSAPSQRFGHILRGYDDIALIKDLDMSVDITADEQHMQEASEYFGSDIPVRFGGTFTGRYSMNLGIWDFITTLMGVEDAYFAMIDEPDFVHACLERLTQSTITGILKANELGLHYDNCHQCHCSYIYTDELLPGFGQGKGPVSSNCWAFGLAQLFTGVSPALMNEFEFPYVSRMAEHYGMIYYGCCDRLDDRLDMVKKIPNVRKVSCSPWSDRKNFAENIGPSLIMSNKPSPAFLAADNVDWDAVRKDLRYTIDLAKSNNANLEMILKDVSTVRFRPDRLDKWSKIALEEASR